MRGKDDMTAFDCVVVACGSFPESAELRALMKSAPNVIACDGAVKNLYAHGIEPTAVVGDMDSLTDEMRLRYADRLHYEAEQEIGRAHV